VDKKQKIKDVRNFIGFGFYLVYKVIFFVEYSVGGKNNGKLKNKHMGENLGMSNFICVYSFANNRI
jgi:hypothetical protein